MKKYLLIFSLLVLLLQTNTTAYAKEPSSDYYQNKGNSVYICMATNLKKEIFEVFFQTGGHHAITPTSDNLNLTPTKGSKIYVYKDKQLYFAYNKVVEIGDGTGNNTYLVFMMKAFNSIKLIDIHIDHEVPEDTTGEIFIPNPAPNAILQITDKLQIQSGFCQ